MRLKIEAPQMNAIDRYGREREREHSLAKRDGKETKKYLGISYEHSIAE